MFCYVHVTACIHPGPVAETVEDEIEEESEEDQRLSILLSELSAKEDGKGAVDKADSNKEGLDRGLTDQHQSQPGMEEGDTAAVEGTSDGNGQPGTDEDIPKGESSTTLEEKEDKEHTEEKKKEEDEGSTEEKKAEENEGTLEEKKKEEDTRHSDEKEDGGKTSDEKKTEEDKNNLEETVVNGERLDEDGADGESGDKAAGENEGIHSSLVSQGIGATGVLIVVSPHPQRKESLLPMKRVSPPVQ